MSSASLAVWNPAATSFPEVAAPVKVLPLPWRDPASVSKADLARYIAGLETACRENPLSADLKTCLGIAYAMNFEAYKSLDALEAAREAEPANFFAQLKLAELHYRLRTLPRAEQETLRAVDLAGNPWELSLARKQLLEIRKLIREGSQRPEFNKSLKIPAIAFAVGSALLCLIPVLSR